MLAPWTRDAMETAGFQDKRLNERVAQILSDLGQRPTASIPAACGGYNETVAAYRFFDNDKATYEAILQPHVACTRRRIAAHSVALLIQDRSELDRTRPQQQVAGAGPLDRSSRREGFVHLLQAFTTDGTPLGAVGVELWARPQAGATAPEKKRPRRGVPIEDKESFRWLDGLRQARSVAQDCPEVACVCIADSEADIYELLAEPRGERPVHWRIRACHDDRVVRVEKTADDDPTAAPDAAATWRLREQAMSAAVLFTKEVAVRGRVSKVSGDPRPRRQSRPGKPASPTNRRSRC